MIISRQNLQALNRAFNAAFRAGFETASPGDVMQIAMESTSTTEEEEYAWLGQWPQLREWIGERAVRSIADYGYTIRNKDFESTVEVFRNKIADDRYGIYGPMMTEMGRAAAVHPAQLAVAQLRAGFTATCYDGQFFFDSDHEGHDGASVSNVSAGALTPWYLLDLSRALKPIIFQRRADYQMTFLDNPTDEDVFKRKMFVYGVDGRCNTGFGLWQLAYGSRVALNGDNYEAARVAMMNFRGDQGRPMGIMPTHLVVPPALEHAARQLLIAERDGMGATNVWQGTAQLIVSPWLAAA